MRGFIADGYTEWAVIEEEIGVHEAISIRFRPMTALERSVLFDKWGELSARQQIDKAAEALASHVTEWDLQDWSNQDDPRPVEVAAENMKRLDLVLFNKLVDRISRFSESAAEGQQAKN